MEPGGCSRVLTTGTKEYLVLLYLGLVTIAIVVIPGALLIGHLMMRRRQLAEAQAYARIRALRALGQRMAEESGAASRRYKTVVPDKKAQRKASSHT